jgi:hypothetical protein
VVTTDARGEVAAHPLPEAQLPHRGVEEVVQPQQLPHPPSDRVNPAAGTS